MTGHPYIPFVCGENFSFLFVGFLNYHAKKGSKMVGMMDVDQNLFPSSASFGASFCSH